MKSKIKIVHTDRDGRRDDGVKPKAVHFDLLPKLTDDALDVVGPLGPVVASFLWRRRQPDALEARAVLAVASLGLSERDDGTAVALGARAQEDGAHGQGHGEDEAVVVVGVLANQVHAAWSATAVGGWTAKLLKNTIIIAILKIYDSLLPFEMLL